MWIYYGIALVPLGLGAALWLLTRRVTFGEWLVGSLIGFAIAGGFHLYAVGSLVDDVEMWSGRLVHITHHPAWQAEPSGEGADRDDGERPESWSATADYGGGALQSYPVTRAEFEALHAAFGGGPLETVEVEKAGFVSGDPNVYVARNLTGVLIPTHTTRRYENLVRAGPSLFSFAAVPEGVEVYAHPAGEVDRQFAGILAIFTFILGDVAESRASLGLEGEWRRSGRLLGRAADELDIAAWDRMNARLGPRKKVNLIAIGFAGASAQAHWQEAAWIGGRKNDLVLCYGPRDADGRPGWAYVFGWTDRDVVKRNLETVLLELPAGEALLSAIEAEVEARYQIRAWPAFSYMDVPAPPNVVLNLLIAMAVVQGGYWMIALVNNTRRRAASAGERAAERREAETRRERREEARFRSEMRAHLSDLADPSDPEQLLGPLFREKLEPAARVAFDVLERSEHPAAAGAIAVVYTCPHWGFRAAAAWWLAEHHPEPAGDGALLPRVPALVGGLEAPDRRRRLAADIALDAIEPGWRERAEARARADELLPVLRTGAAGRTEVEAVGYLLADAPTALLELARRAPDRADYLQALARTGAEAALPCFVDAVLSGEPALARAGAAGLSAQAGRLPTLPDDLRARLYPALADLAGEREREHRQARAQALHALGWLGDRRALTLLEGAIDVAVDDVGACEGLRGLGEPGFEAIHRGLGFVDDSESYGRLRLVLAVLGRHGDSRAVPWLQETCLAVEQYGLHRGAVEALYRIGGPAAAAALREIAAPAAGRPEIADKAGLLAAWVDEARYPAWVMRGPT